MQLEEQQFTRWIRRPTEFIASAWYLLASAGQYLVAYAAAFLIQLLALFGLSADQSTQVYLSSTLAQLLLFLLPVLAYMLRHDGVERSMRLNTPKWEALLLAVLAAPVGVMVSDKLSTWWMLLIESLGGTLHGSAVPIPTTLPELGFSLVLTALLPGICEEILFRGGLLGAWERRGTQQALVITSVLFALLHGSVAGFPVQLIMGFVLGYIVIQSDSLLTGIAYHVTHNAAILILSFLASGAAEAADPYADIAGYVTLTGGYPTLIVQTIVWAALYIGLLALLIRSQKKRGIQFDKIIEGDKEPMSWETLVVLIAGLLTVGVTFISDLLTVCGVF